MQSGHSHGYTMNHESMQPERDVDAYDLAVRSFIPGRLRLQVKGPNWADARSRALSLIEHGVALSVESSPVARTMLIHYDAKRWSQDEFMAQLRATLVPGSEYRPQNDRRADDPLADAMALSYHPWTIKSRIPGRIRAVHPLLQYCPPLARDVGRELFQLAGVENYSVNPITSSVLIRYRPDILAESRLIAFLDTILARMRDELEANALSPVPIERTTVQLIGSTAAMLVAGAALVLPVLRPVAMLGTLVASAHIFKSAGEAMVVERKVKVDILDATAIGLAVAYRYTLAGAFMVWVVDVGDVLLESATRQSRALLTEAFGHQVRRAKKLVDGVELEVEVANLEVGDIIVVRTGEQIAVDGTVVAGEAMIDQHALTGEATPVERTVDDGVYAMTAVLAGTIHVRASNTGADTRAAQIVEILEHSIDHKAKLQLTSERIADRMVLPTLGLGSVGQLLRGPSAMLAVINADFGTGIRIAGPLALINSLAVAAQNGIVIKNGGVLESIHELDAIIFDKTGTLTQEVPEVRNVVSYDPAFSEDQILAYVAAAEQPFTHPIARAILNQAAAQGLELPAIEDSEYVMGFGINITLDGHAFRVGSWRFMEREQVDIPASARADLEAIHAQGNSAVFAAIDRRLVGIIELVASARPEAGRVIQFLRDRGVDEIYLISGDHEVATRALANQLGIDRYFAEVLPEDKAVHVRALQERGFKVGMVGDGINDSIALSQADFSISLQGAAHIATDVADVVFMSGDLVDFELLFQLSDQLIANLRRSIALTAYPNSFCIVGALLGAFGVGMSILLNNVFNGVAIANGMLPQFSRVGARPPQVVMEAYAAQRHALPQHVNTSREEHRE